jgi:hypothetical protein
MIDEFYRMCGVFGWNGYGDGREEAKVLFKHALAREFLGVESENVQGAIETPDEEAKTYIQSTESAEPGTVVAQETVGLVSTLVIAGY